MRFTKSLLFLSLVFCTAVAAGPPVRSAELQEERYEADVPDTLDLAERARIAINGLTGICDTTTSPPRRPFSTPTRPSCR